MGLCVAALLALHPGNLCSATAGPAVTAEQMAEYHRKLAEFRAARDKYEAEAAVYWRAIAEKRKARFAKRRSGTPASVDDYVLSQPPLYSGPPRPIDPSAPEVPIPRREIPVVADFLRYAAEHFQFRPEKPASEIEFKRTYTTIAAAAGLTRDQVVRIYGFEAGGNGLYDVQAGLEEPNKPNARAVSTALGYNQLLSTNSVELLAEHGDQFVAALRRKSEKLNGERRSALEQKIAMLQRMVAYSRTVPDEWSAHDRLGRTPPGLGVHALNLDIDIGPLLQTQKLVNSVLFARQRLARPLTAAELEMLNLTGDGNGLDMVAMPAAMRERVPTSNFFQQTGYERNPVAIEHNTVAKLLARTDAIMDAESAQQGAKDLAAAFPTDKAVEN